mmetsp:Transcript_15366/g.46799  ORF Transcript_15366/g.46799 Transcript_15366/m.46799 type:complete len:269 (-) Transcript_15366:4413-5219(-)
MVPRVVQPGPARCLHRSPSSRSRIMRSASSPAHRASFASKPRSAQLRPHPTLRRNCTPYVSPHKRSSYWEHLFLRCSPLVALGGAPLLGSRQEDIRCRCTQHCTLWGPLCGGRASWHLLRRWHAPAFSFHRQQHRRGGASPMRRTRRHSCRSTRSRCLFVGSRFYCSTCTCLARASRPSGNLWAIARLQCATYPLSLIRLIATMKEVVVIAPIMVLELPKLDMSRAESRKKRQRQRPCGLAMVAPAPKPRTVHAMRAGVRVDCTYSIR